MIKVFGATVWSCRAETHPPKKKTLNELKFMWRQVQSQDLGTLGRLLQPQCGGGVCSDRWAPQSIRLSGGVKSQCVQSCESRDPREVLRLEVQVRCMRPSRQVTWQGKGMIAEGDEYMHLHPRRTRLHRRHFSFGGIRGGMSTQMSLVLHAVST